MGVKIEDLTALSSSTFADDDIFEIEQYVSPSVYVSRKMTGAQVREAIKTYALQIATYTAGLTSLQLSDAGKLLKLNVGSANDLRIPAESGVNFPIGTTAYTQTFEYTSNIKIIGSVNISSYEFYINGLYYGNNISQLPQSEIQINTNDVFTVNIIKTNNSLESIFNMISFIV